MNKNALPQNHAVLRVYAASRAASGRTSVDWLEWRRALYGGRSLRRRAMSGGFHMDAVAGGKVFMSPKSWGLPARILTLLGDRRQITQMYPFPRLPHVMGRPRARTFLHSLRSRACMQTLDLNDKVERRLSLAGARVFVLRLEYMTDRAVPCIAEACAIRGLSTPGQRSDVQTRK